MKEIVKAIKAGKSFIITTHVNPDGDALGSAIALAMALKHAGKKVIVYNRDGVPDTYGFLPGADIVQTSPGDSRAETIILVDCNNLARAGLQDCGSCKTSIVIDHHDTDNDFGDVKWIEPDTPATGMMILELIRALKIPLSRDMAQNLYVAVTLDTGTFRYANTTAKALRMGAELTEAGADPGYVADRLYSNWTSNRFSLFRKVLESLDMEGSICFMIISMNMIEETSTSHGDTENFVNFPLLMDRVKATVLLKEIEADRWKVSMRSKGDINVALVAENFNGGGHHNAAGCTIDGRYEDIRKTLTVMLRDSGAP